MSGYIQLDTEVKTSAPDVLTWSDVTGDIQFDDPVVNRSLTVIADRLADSEFDHVQVLASDDGPVLWEWHR